MKLRYLALYTTDRSLQFSDPSHVFLFCEKIKREDTMTRRKGEGSASKVSSVKRPSPTTNPALSISLRMKRSS